MQRRTRPLGYYKSKSRSSMQVLNNGPILASFCSFSSFSHYNFNNTNRKNVDGVLGIRTQGRFESSHRKTIIEHWFTANCVEKTKIMKKAGNGRLKKISKRVYWGPSTKSRPWLNRTRSRPRSGHRRRRGSSSGLISADHLDFPPIDNGNRSKSSSELNRTSSRSGLEIIFKQFRCVFDMLKP